MIRLFFALLLVGRLAAQQIPAKDRIVLVISLDGFPAYSLADPKLPVPMLRRLAREGAIAARMKTVNPTVTWPNHTTLVTGVAPAKHSVIYNGMAERDAEGTPVKVEPWRDKAEMVKVETVYDAAHAAGLTTAQMDWVAIYRAPTITWSFAEVPSPDGRTEQEMIAADLIGEKDVAEFRKGNITWRDEIWTKAAIHLIQKHRPNLMLLHLLNTDSMHHSYGPRTLAGNTALALADARVGEIHRALETAKLLDRTTFVIVSDHGFKTVKQNIHPNVLLKKMGLEQRVAMVPEGGTAMLYVRSQDVVQRLRTGFAGLEGVARVIGPEDYASLGLPAWSRASAVPDLVLAAKDGYSFSGGADGEVIVPVKSPQGAHGYLNSDPEMDAIFVASGYGIRPGTKLDEISNLDVAPTVAALLGVKLKAADGKPLPILK